MAIGQPVRLEVHQNINEKLNQVIQLKDDESVDNLLISFTSFLDAFIEIGHYDTATWPITETRPWWYMFDQVAKSRHIGALLGELRSRIDKTTVLSELEPLHYLEVELKWGTCRTLDDYKPLEKAVKDHLERYPYNIEFIHCLGHVLAKYPNRFQECKSKYEQCFECWGVKTPPSSITSYFGKRLAYVQEAILDSRFDEAEEELIEMQNFKPFNDDPHFHNLVFVYRDRLKDRKYTEDKAESIKSAVTQVIAEENDKQNKKSIEQLGLFSAVIALIITAATASFSSSGINSVLTLISVGLILVLFIGTLTLFNDGRTTEYRTDFRFWILVVYSLITLGVLGVQITKPSDDELVQQLVKQELVKAFEVDKKSYALGKTDTDHE
ncbi:hypothetical protein JKJ11_08525 [Vibrio sp. SCSIO 43133]|uniref:hypothetical protein n=1 Tax=Vibrio sp. SCSIO 43133 TaxID=2802577 RepID=UPI0020754FD3|nr:hypothetical protein [Vibrio sp. SCSIO 43133]USD99036.1 hypothetical protein JKJ11_08525 [Vibrio sp. SCSIO 43133]